MRAFFFSEPQTKKMFEVPPLLRTVLGPGLLQVSVRLPARSQSVRQMPRPELPDLRVGFYLLQMPFGILLLKSGQALHAVSAKLRDLLFAPHLPKMRATFRTGFDARVHSNLPHQSVFRPRPVQMRDVPRVCHLPRRFERALPVVPELPTPVLGCLQPQIGASFCSLVARHFLPADLTTARFGGIRCKKRNRLRIVRLVHRVQSDKRGRSRAADSTSREPRKLGRSRVPVDAGHSAGDSGVFGLRLVLVEGRGPSGFFRNAVCPGGPGGAVDFDDPLGLPGFAGFAREHRKAVFVHVSFFFPDARILQFFAEAHHNQQLQFRVAFLQAKRVLLLLKSLGRRAHFQLPSLGDFAHNICCDSVLVSEMHLVQK